MRWAQDNVKKLLLAIVDYILPYRCIVCSELMVGNHGICIPCFKKINFISEPFCAQCGFLFEFKIDEKMLCGKCIAHPPTYDIARSLLKFDENSKKLIHKFKYNDCTSYAKLFANALVAKYKHEFADINLIVPIPMHRIKRIFRQYNPPQILAFELSKLLGVKMAADGLIKIRWTKPQTKLTKAKRQKNLDGSVLVNTKIDFANLNIMLVDDVKTTGTTAHYCAKLLKKAGANQVKLATIGVVN